MSRNWKEDIHDQLKDFSRKAPEGLLDEVKSEMLRRGLSQPSAGIRRNSPLVLLLRAASVAAVLIVLLGIGYLWQDSAPSMVKDIHRSSSLEPIQPSLPMEQEEPATEPIKPVTPRLVSQASPIKIAVADTLVVIEEEEKPLAEPSVGDEKEEQNEEKATEEAPKEESTQRAGKPNVEPSSKQQWVYSPSPRKKSAFAVGAYYSGVVAQMASRTGNVGISNSGPSIEPDTTSVASRACSHPHSEYRNKVSHHLPVKFGVSFRYYLNRKWNLQTGLTYSYLASDLSKSNFCNSYETEQKLHYIGVPLQIGYQFWENKRFRGYMSFGVQAEKLVSGKSTTRHWEHREYQSSRTENISDKRLLFSTLAAIGAEYLLGDDFSLYLEPGLHYYFKNGNGFQTHYNDQPLNINLTIGFRFHWNK